MTSRTVRAPSVRDRLTSPAQCTRSAWWMSARSAKAQERTRRPFPRAWSDREELPGRRGMTNLAHIEPLPRLSTLWYTATANSRTSLQRKSRTASTVRWSGRLRSRSPRLSSPRTAGLRTGSTWLPARSSDTPARGCSRVHSKEFTEPVALSSTRPADLPLPRTAAGLSFDLLALRARCVEEATG